MVPVSAVDVPVTLCTSSCSGDVRHPLIRYSMTVKRKKRIKTRKDEADDWYNF
jgi:hypothetical protein